MKKLVLFLMVTTLSVLSLACSSDDSKGENNKKELFLTADGKQGKVTQGSTVKFSVTTEEGEEVIEIDTDVSFYINDVEVKNPYTFTELGTFDVVAKKNGYKDSNTLTIIVVEEKEAIDEEKLTIRVVGEVTEVMAEDKVVFEVVDEDGALVKDATIVLDNKTNVGYEWIPKEPGTYELFAKKEGYTKSDVIVVTVKEKPEKQLILALISDSDRLFVNDTLQMSIKDERGRGVSQAVLYKDGIALATVSVEGVFDVIFTEAGTYELKAKVDELESNTVTITVKKTAAVNTFVFKEDTYTIIKSTLFYTGIVEVRTAVFKAEWQVEAYDADGKTAVVVFYTPATQRSEGVFDFENPNAENTVTIAMGVMHNGNVLGIATTDLQLVFRAVSNSPTNYTGQYLASALDIGGSFFSLNYNGDTKYIDDSESQGITGTGRYLTVKVDRVKKTTKTLRQLGRI
ncbi:hypothetical protein [Myroides sp. DW712]|uniref:hypothetical protein n=1 Tax=Myroides sp. DW712 TaxID=3389800 RepID=UPI00397B3889